ncbi:MAG: cytochrome c oxidase subunit II [Acidimicrobiia bacterium]
MRSTNHRSRFLLAAAVPLVGLGGACASDARQDSLDPQGPVAHQIDDLFMPIFIVAGLVGVLVMGLVIASIIRHRERPGRPEPVQVHGNTKLEIGWTAAPALLLLFVAVPTVNTIFELDEEPDGNPLQVEVYGHMWWWEYKYPDLAVTTANELHIPTGRPIRLELRSIEPGIPAPPGVEISAGVIHSFWVPKLAGKQDVVPGRVNKLTLEASEPGTYFGQCAEYCNLAHADMRLRVIAQSPGDFDRWVDEQKQPAEEPGGGEEAEGFELFTGKGGCVSCHSVDGIEGAEARVGPDLTHLQSRETFGGATFELNPDNLRRWVTNPSSMKPMRPEEGTGMPARGAAGSLTDEEIDKIVAYLRTLE